jgi:2-phosphosulfolactate phosphatase
VTDGQTQYQVRFDWGLDGAHAIAKGADVIVLVDVLELSKSPDVAAALDPGPAVIAGNLRNRTAIARWALERQGDKGDRFTIGIVAVAEAWDGGGIRFAVEDLLAAGAIIDALADLGIDYCSPESAAASAAFTGLRNATGHLIGASASGRTLAAAGQRADIDFAIDLDVSSEVPVLREFASPS